MKQILYLLTVMICGLALSSCKGGGGGGGGGGVVAGAQTNGTDNGGETSTVKGKAPDGLLSSLWYFRKAGESKAFLVLNGRATPTGVLAVVGGSEEDRFVDGPGYRATYQKTGPDTAVLYLSYDDETEITEKYIAHYNPITHAPVEAERVVGTRVTKYYMEIKMRFDYSYTSSDHTKPISSGDIISLIYKVDGTPRYTLSSGTFATS